MPLPRIHRSTRTYDRLARFIPSHVPNSGNNQPPAKRPKFSEQDAIPPNDNDRNHEPFDPSWPEDSGSVLDIDELEDRIREVLDQEDGQDLGRQLPLDIDLEDLQRAHQYEDVLPQVEDGEVLSTLHLDQEQDADKESTTEATSSSSSPPLQTVPPSPLPPSISNMLPPQSRRPSDLSDLSEALPQPRIRDEDPSPFLLALGLWCEEVGVSRTQYSGLREILGMLEPHPLLQRLPFKYGTLRKRTKGHLPQLLLRRVLLPLAPDKLPTLPERQKKDSAQIPREYLYFFDPVILFQTILRSDLVQKMHFGFGEFRSNPVELWHSHAWTSSVRTTSGQFARYRNQDPIFPSDWISYQCSASGCSLDHLGRIVGVGYDFLDQTPLEEQGKLKIKVQHAYRNSEIPASFHAVYYFGRCEALLLPTFSFIKEDAILFRHLDVRMDYAPLPSPQAGLTANTMVVRSLLNEKRWIQPLAWSAPLRAELELETYSRDYFHHQFNSAGGTKCLSLPFFLFIDGFGLYRNAYRSLMGVYIQIAALKFHERMRRANVFSLTLGPHGSNFNDVINSLHSLRSLDKGLVLELPQPTRVCAFTLCFLGDMPQQQANAGFKSQRANLGCRSCLVTAEGRDNLDYDIIQNGRFHRQTMQQRREMNTLSTKAKREAFATKWGLTVEEPALFRLTPALDIILTRPSDPAHSEYAGLCKQLHHLLLETILTVAGATAYVTALRSWPFAPGFARIQSPLHHLKSYSLSEHARWIVIIPALLLCCLREKHVHPHYLHAVQTHLDQHSDGFTATELITRVFAFAARSTSLLMTDELRERSEMMIVVKRARSHFQLLLSFAAVAANSNPRSRSATPVRRGSIEPTSTILPSIEDERGGEGYSSIQPQGRTTQKAQEFKNDQRRPNVHVAVHYDAVMQEYGMPSNLNVLIGEDKHRWFKKAVYQTNHIKVERLLLAHEGLRQSVRLILMGGFKEEDHEITTLLQQLYRKCPTLLQTILTTSEHHSLRNSLDEDEDDDTVTLQSDTTHRDVTATGRVSAKQCKFVLGLPTRPSDRALMTAQFKSQLRAAWAREYNMSNVTHFGTGNFRWCNQIAFTSGPSDHRYTFKVGDFTQFHTNFLGRISGLLVMALSAHSPPHVFFKLTVATRQDQPEPVLEVDMYQMSNNELIVGLPGIEPLQPYMIPVSRSQSTKRQLQLRQPSNESTLSEEAQELLMIPWTLQYL